MTNSGLHIWLKICVMGKADTIAMAISHGWISILHYCSYTLVFGTSVCLRDHFVIFSLAISASLLLLTGSLRVGWGSILLLRGSGIWNGYAMVFHL